jgi:NADH-quinone oxidoreductase subunit M
VVVAAAFTLRAIALGFFGRQEAPASPGAAGAHAQAIHLEPITLAEKAGALLLVGATVLVGLKPDLLLDWINPALQSPLLQAAMKAVAP